MSQSGGHRRRRDSGHKPNHERWMISYADLLTLLLAVFIVLYATSAQNKAKVKEMAESMLIAFNGTPPSFIKMPSSPHAPDQNLPKPVHIPVQSEPAPAQKRNPVVTPVHPPAPKPPIVSRIIQRRIQPSVFAIHRLAQKLSHLLAPQMQAHTIQLLAKPLSITIRLNAKILFHTGHAKLTKAAVQLLRPLGDVLRNVPSGYHISIEGYTDNKPIQTVKYPSNWQLSTSRATSVLLLFRSVHVPGKLLSVEGFSKYRPLESNKTSKGRARNRRVEIRITAPRELRHESDRLGTETPAPMETGRGEAPAASSGQPVGSEGGPSGGAKAAGKATSASPTREKNGQKTR